MNYIVLEYSNKEVLEENVNKYLNLNYELYGYTQIYKCPTKDVNMYLQVVIKKHKEQYHWSDWE